MRLDLGARHHLELRVAVREGANRVDVGDLRLVGLALRDVVQRGLEAVGEGEAVAFVHLMHVEPRDLLGAARELHQALVADLKVGLQGRPGLPAISPRDDVGACAEAVGLEAELRGLDDRAHEADRFALQEGRVALEARHGQPEHPVGRDVARQRGGDLELGAFEQVAHRGDLLLGGDELAHGFSLLSVRTVVARTT